MMTNLHFAHPYLLLLLTLLPALWWWRRQRKKQWHVHLQVSDLPKGHTPPLRGKLRELLFYLRLIALGLLLIALARPQYIQKKEKVKADGVDIMLVMDISSSMLSRDFKPDRLEASKLMAQRFADQRPYDRIGLVAFAGEAFTKSPLTTDKKLLKKFLDELAVGQLEDGTAIGMGLATAVNRLKDSEAKSKIIILLTDGVNNAGYIQPMTAAELAQSLHIKVYTIGVGSTGRALTPVSRNLRGDYIFDYAPVEIDEQLLREISRLTGGRYFRATDEETLRAIYDEINEMEKTKIEVFSFTRRQEAFHPLVFWAMLLLIADFLLRQSLLNSLPS